MPVSDARLGEIATFITSELGTSSPARLVGAPRAQRVQYYLDKVPQIASLGNFIFFKKNNNIYEFLNFFESAVASPVACLWHGAQRRRNRRWAILDAICRRGHVDSDCRDGSDQRERCNASVSDGVSNALQSSRSRLCNEEARRLALLVAKARRSYGWLHFDQVAQRTRTQGARAAWPLERRNG